jgi:GDPmannose 4,6-dehydratase
MAYVEAMWRMLQVDKPEDFVIATGESHSVREFCELAFSHAGVPITWRGKGIEEKGIGPEGRILLEIDPRYFRPTEVDILLGNSTKARINLGWQSTVAFKNLVYMMVDSDEKLAREEAAACSREEAGGAHG